MVVQLSIWLMEYINHEYDGYIITLMEYWDWILEYHVFFYGQFMGCNGILMEYFHGGYTFG